MFLTRTLQHLYSVTIDRSKFREVATRLIVFGVPLFYWGRQVSWHGLWFVGAGVLIRAWAAGHLHKDATLAASGPYLLVRHPLYLGSCLLALGFIVALHHWFVFITIGGVTVLTYIHTIRHEEQNLRARFGPAYLEYSNRVAPLWIRPAAAAYFFQSLGSASSRRFSFQRYLVNREYECLLGVAAILGVMAIWTVASY